MKMTQGLKIAMRRQYTFVIDRPFWGADVGESRVNQSLRPAGVSSCSEESGPSSGTMKATATLVPTPERLASDFPWLNSFRRASMSLARCFTTCPLRTSVQGSDASEWMAGSWPAN